MRVEVPMQRCMQSHKEQRDQSCPIASRIRSTPASQDYIEALRRPYAYAAEPEGAPASEVVVPPRRVRSPTRMWQSDGFKKGRAGISGGAANGATAAAAMPAGPRRVCPQPQGRPSSRRASRMQGSLSDAGSVRRCFCVIADMRNMRCWRGNGLAMRASLLAWQSSVGSSYCPL
jgi:hypothetical protein